MPHTLDCRPEPGFRYLRSPPALAHCTATMQCQLPAPQGAEHCVLFFFLSFLSQAPAHTPNQLPTYHMHMHPLPTRAHSDLTPASAGLALLAPTVACIPGFPTCLSPNQPPTYLPILSPVCPLESSAHPFRKPTLSVYICNAQRGSKVDVRTAGRGAQMQDRAGDGMRWVQAGPKVQAQNCSGQELGAR